MSAKPTKQKYSTIARVNKRADGLNYHAWSGGIASLLEEARQQSARHINAILTATYWEIGRRIVEFVQQGESKADYGEEILLRLSADLTKKFGRGFSHRNLDNMRLFYIQHPTEQISQTLSAKFNRQGLPAFFQSVSEKFLLPSKCQTLSDKSSAAKISQTVSAKLEIYETPSRNSAADISLYLEALCHAFPLSWSHYVRLLSVEKPEARAFYEAESLRGGWSVRQLDRQVSHCFTNAPHSRRTKRSCSPLARRRDPKTP